MPQGLVPWLEGESEACRQWETSQVARHAQWQGRGQNSGLTFSPKLILPLCPTSVPTQHTLHLHVLINIQYHTILCKLVRNKHLVQSFSNHHLWVHLHPSAQIRVPARSPKPALQWGRHGCSFQGPLRNHTSQRQGLSSKKIETTRIYFPIWNGGKEVTWIQCPVWWLHTNLWGREPPPEPSHPIMAELKKQGRSHMVPQNAQGISVGNRAGPWWEVKDVRWTCLQPTHQHQVIAFLAFISQE